MATDQDLDIDNQNEEIIVQLHALEMAIKQQKLEAIHRHDIRGAWRRDGANSMVNWLCGRLNVSFANAKAMVECAEALEQLPATKEALGRGAISYDQVRDLVRFATPERDEELANQAPGWSAAEVRKRARDEAPITQQDIHDTYRKRFFSLNWDERERLCHLSGILPAEEGAVLEKALLRIAQEMNIDPAHSTYNRINADALVHLASLRLGSDDDTDRATVVVNIDMDTLAGGEGVGHLENGIPVPVPTVRRLSCDGRVQPFTADKHGTALGIGRASRKIPAWLLRQIKERDGHCTFPGCYYDKWLHAHHVKHWATGGPTDLDNLVMLCGPHHRLVHDGGWKLRRREDETIEFVRPNGLVLQRGPTPLRPDIRERFLGGG